MEELVIRHLRGEATPDEDNRIRQWRRSSAANDGAYRSLAALWSLAGAADPFAGRLEHAPDPDLLIQRAETQRESEPRLRLTLRGTAREMVASPPVRVARRARWPGRLAGMAAVAAGFLFAGFGLGVLFSDAEPARGLLAEGEITTGSGEMATVTLADGTSIRLGPRSRIRVAQEQAGPVAELDGRAFFAVKKDSARSFTVRTAQGDAVVLGTRFEVRAEDDEFRVLVVDGSVRVQAGGESVELSEAHVGRASGNAPLSVDRVDDAYAHLDWMGNALVFQATPLGRALREVERRYSVSMVLMDSTLADLSVTASFTGAPLAQVVLVLCEISGASCSIEGDVVRIRARPAPRRTGTSTGSV